MPRRFVTRGSTIHGKGVFAARRIPAGTRLIEYAGERIDQDEALRRYPEDGREPHHTFLFALDEETVVDGGADGNSARFINHSCEPNCEAVIDGGRIYIEAIREIRPGEELVYDYNFILEERHTAAAKRRYACRCGAPACRGTILGDKRKWRRAQT